MGAGVSSLRNFERHSTPGTATRGHNRVIGIFSGSNPMGVWLLGILATVLLLFYLYIRKNDQSLTRLSPEALAFSPTRCTPDMARSAAKQFAEHPPVISDHLPPQTGRRYIVVGGVSESE